MRIVAAAPTAADAAALRDLHVESWMATYRNQLEPTFFAERVAVHRSRDWAELVRRQMALGGGVLVARNREGMGGLCQYGPTEDEDEDPASVGHVHRLYVHPDRQRAGIGRALLTEATGRLREGGVPVATLWAFEVDRRARAFYEALGFQADGGRRFNGGVDVRYRLTL